MTLPPLPAWQLPDVGRLETSWYLQTPRLPRRALLTLWNPETGESVIFDPPPREVRTSAGTTSASISLDEFGTVSRPTGREPTQYSFSGVWYGTTRADTPLILEGRYRPPGEWRLMIEEFHRLQAQRVGALELHLEGFDIPPFIKPVDIGSLEFAYRGGSGDLQYSITLIERRHVEVGVEGDFDVVEAGPRGSAEDQGEPPIPETVLTRPGDDVYGLAHSYLGTTLRWQEIVSLNQLTDADVDDLPAGLELRMPGGRRPPDELTGYYAALDEEAV